MRILVQFFRFIVGLFFIISGFVKIIDPIGLGYKLEEYFSINVLNLPLLSEYSLSLAAFFSIFEIILGVMLVLGIYRKFTCLSLLLTIVFFSFLTFYSAYYNKVSDCGCFGDALKMEPWVSFYKDVILLVLIIILCFGIKYIHPFFSKKLNASILFISLSSCLIISYWGIYHLPIIDFRAYAVGKNIKEGMKSAEELGLQPTVYETFYTMKNKLSGEFVKISDQEYVNDKKWYEDGSDWELQEEKTESIIAKKGYESPIHDFSFDCNGQDKTSFYLNESKVILFVVPFVDKLSKEQIDKMNHFSDEAIENNFHVIALVNHTITGSNFEFCLMDQTTMKTMIRSNPGIILLDKGTIKAKFNYNDFPSISKLIEK